MYILYMLALNNTPFVHSRGYLQYLNNALPGGLWAPAPIYLILKGVASAHG